MTKNLHKGADGSYMLRQRFDGNDVEFALFPPGHPFRPGVVIGTSETTAEIEVDGQVHSLPYLSGAKPAVGRPALVDMASGVAFFVGEGSEQ